MTNSIEQTPKKTDRLEVRMVEKDITTIEYNGKTVITATEELYILSKSKQIAGHP